MDSKPSRLDPPRSLEHFVSGGKEIRIETFTGAEPYITSSIIFLHGATGIEFANRFIGHLAQLFATHGFRVHLLRYFDRTGLRYADERTIKRSSADWLETIHDAVTFIHSRYPEAQIAL